MDKNLKIEVATPSDKRSYENAVSCSAPGILGQFQVLPGHTALVSALGIGEVKIEFSDKTQSYAVSGGFVEVLNDNVLFLLETAEEAEGIDTDRAEKARKRAEDRLQDRSKINAVRAEAALARATNRLKVAKKRKSS
ncbi:MAG: F0F1 ATP synthase subunit epsilon, partial [Calditrichota bacterium]